MTIYKKGEIYFRIEVDIDPVSPRDFDPLGTIVTWHRRYFLGDEQPKIDPEEFEETLPEGTVIVPVFMLDHSGVKLSTEPFSCPWDSGQLGIIYATPERIKERGVASKVVRNILRDEVKLYSHYIEGAVYGFTKYRQERCATCGTIVNNLIDSCTGFYGHDHEKNGLLETAEIKDLSEWEEVGEYPLC